MAQRLEQVEKMAENLLVALQSIEADMAKEGLKEAGPAFDFAQQARGYASACLECCNDSRLMHSRKKK